MTGVNTAMPLKLGSLTVLSRIRPPILWRGGKFDVLLLAGLKNTVFKDTD